MTQSLDYVPKMGGWKADSTMRDTNDHIDLKLEDHWSALASSRAGISDPAVEANGVLDLRKFCSPVENQGHLGSCTANAVAGALEFLQIRDGLPLSDLSRLFIYYNARLMMQEQDKDEGSYIRIAMGTLSSLGTCAESKWPYDVSKVFVRPTWGSYREGYANKIGNYYRINGSGPGRVEQIKEALREQHVVVFGMTIDDSFVNIGSDGMVPMPTNSRLNPGGHATTLVGFDDNRQLFIGRNSWGTRWGDRGYYYINYDHLDAADASDFWVPCALA